LHYYEISNLRAEKAEKKQAVSGGQEVDIIDFIHEVIGFVIKINIVLLLVTIKYNSRY
jgi:hypothetical protein